jgi:hypothetical protein
MDEHETMRLVHPDALSQQESPLDLLVSGLFKFGVQCRLRRPADF